MFYSLDDIATFEEWSGDPLENAVIVDAETLFRETRSPQLPSRGGAPVYVAPEAWPGAAAADDWVDDAAWDEEEAPYEWDEEEEDGWVESAPALSGAIAWLSSVAVELTAGLLLLFLLLALALDRAEMAPPPAQPLSAVAPLPAPPTPPVTGDPNVIMVPYETYWITQGLHGASYGHLAVDLAAGKGSPILAPINGTVRGSYIDQYGNTTLVIENDRYRVTLLHGDYVAIVGETVRAGQPVGRESNHGYTTDMNGNSCRGRECGFHTHLNIFDKQVGRNVDPLQLLGLRTQ